MITVVAITPSAMVASLKAARADETAYAALSRVTRKAMGTKAKGGFRQGAHDYILDVSELEALIAEHPTAKIVGVWKENGYLHPGYPFDEAAWRSIQPQDPVYGPEDAEGNRTITGYKDKAELVPVHQFAAHPLRKFTVE